MVTKGKEPMILVNTDGGSLGNPGKGYYGFVVSDTDKNIIFQDSGFIGELITNNEAEYIAVIKALEWLQNSTLDNNVRFLSDSILTVNSINCKWKCKAKNLVELLNKIQLLRIHLSKYNITFGWIPRELNEKADAVCHSTISNLNFRELS